jgi:hypothetical protein
LKRRETVCTIKEKLFYWGKKKKNQLKKNFSEQADMYGTRSGHVRHRRLHHNHFAQLKALSSMRVKLVTRDWKSMVAQLVTPILVCLFLLLAQGLTNLILNYEEPHPPTKLLPRVSIASFSCDQAIWPSPALTEKVCSRVSISSNSRSA